MAILPLLVAPSTLQLQAATPPPTKNIVESYLELPKAPSFPDYTSNYQKTVVIPQAQAAQAAQEAAQAAAAAPVPEPAPPEPQTVTQAVESLNGILGYSLAFGNCVDEPGVNNPGYGNPIDWPVTSFTPWIGASALFTFNHVAVVAGIWSNGDIEVRQRNCPGCPTRYPLSALRGFR